MDALRKLSPAVPVNPHKSSEALKIVFLLISFHLFFFTKMSNVHPRICQICPIRAILAEFRTASINFHPIMVIKAFNVWRINIKSQTTKDGLFTHMRTGKTHISLCGCTGSVESLLYAIYLFLSLYSVNVNKQHSDEAIFSISVLCKVSFQVLQAFLFFLW